MPYKPRILVDDGYYHLMGRGNNGLAVFKEVNGFFAFKQLLYEIKKKYSFHLHHYCLMPNHFHLLARIGLAHELPKLMHALMRNYSRFYCGKTGHTGHIWQGRYKSPLIDRDSYLLVCGRYIENNPVRAGIVNDPARYPFSSYKYYAHNEPNALIEMNPCLDNKNKLTFKRAYQEFVSGGIS